MGIRSYCRIPVNRTGRSIEGSCPALLYDLFAELEGSIEINIAAYLFNNPIYTNFLKSLANKGCKVNITSLPTLGYSDKPLKVDGVEGKISAREMASEIYESISQHKNIELRIFPHLYVWYGALYADGGASYSFHVKAIYARFPNGRNKCILSSGNFMFTDPSHSDNILILEGLPSFENPFRSFFNDLKEYSIPFGIFNRNYPSYKDQFLYSFLGKEINLSKNDFKNCFFSAPFYFYDSEGSNHYAVERIIELIEKAERRVWVCAQHFHDLVSFDTQRNTLIDAIYRKYLSNPQVEFKFLKQVPHSSLADKRRAGIAETLFQFVLKAEQRYNRLVHDKFMLIDDTLLVSTANYTSTQFAFGLRKMVSGQKENKISKEDYFSEVNGFIILNPCPKEIISQYEGHFYSLWQNGEIINITL